MGHPHVKAEPRTGPGTGDALPGGMHARCREFDWASTPIGAAETWPDWLRTAVRICLDAAFPSAVLWGPDFLQIYNDAVVPVFRDKHPAALGLPAPQVWAEAWSSIGPALEAVRCTGVPFTAEDMPVMLERGGTTDEAFFTFGFSALRDEHGTIGGVLAIGIESTEKVRAADARLRAQEGLRESEERLAALIEQLPLGVGVFDRDGRWTLRNATMRRYVGERIPSAESHQLPRWRAWDAAGRLLEPADFPGARALGGERVSGVEMLHIADDGSTTWTRVGAVPFRDPSGDVQAAIAVVQDVDRERRALEAVQVSEHALRASEALAAQRLEELEAIYRDAPVGLAVIDTELRFRHVNERLAAMNGMPVADHIGRSVAEIVPHIASEIAAIARRVMETGQAARDLVVTGETAARPGVKRHWVEQWYPLRDGAGQVVGINIVVDEVTERLRAEATLEETQRRLEEALVTARMAYWDWDPATDRTVASDSMAEVCGLLPGQALDSSAFGHTIMHPADREAHQAKVSAAVARGEGWHGEFRIIRPRDGRIVWLEELATVTRSPDGGAPHVTGMIWDITDRKRGETAAEHERTEREREALRRRLAGAEEDERRRLSRELHDQLGQHLTAFVLGLAESRRLIACGKSADERLAGLEELAREMTRDARHLALELRPPELDDVGLESALASYVEQWKGRYGVAAELAVGARAGGGVPSEIGTAIYRIVQEALTNVAKHAAATHVTVQLDLLPGEVRLVVEDDGRGFDPDAVAAKTAAEGRLGLAGMRERVGLVGGTFELESAPGRGTTLYVRVPLADA